MQVFFEMRENEADAAARCCQFISFSPAFIRILMEMDD
jgi:hypothetical protein